jgi:hypothetical protein
MSESRNASLTGGYRNIIIFFMNINVFLCIGVQEIVQQNDNTYARKCNQSGLQISAREGSCVVELTNTVKTKLVP